MFSCVTMQSNVVIRDSYREGESLDNTRFQLMEHDVITSQSNTPVRYF